MTLDSYDVMCSQDHVWLAPDGRVGLTPTCFECLGEVRHVELPAVGACLRVAIAFGSLEAHKGLVDVYAPCEGRVVEVNLRLDGDPDLVRRQPLTGGWLVRVEGAVPGRLFSTRDYEARVRARSIRAPLPTRSR